MKYIGYVLFAILPIRKRVNKLKQSHFEKACNSDSFRITSFILKDCRLHLFPLFESSHPVFPSSLSLILSITQSQLCMEHQTSFFLHPPSSLPLSLSLPFFHSPSLSSQHYVVKCFQFRGVSVVCLLRPDHLLVWHMEYTHFYQSGHSVIWVQLQDAQRTASIGCWIWVRASQDNNTLRTEFSRRNSA